MTIKERVRIAWEQDLEVVVKCKPGSYSGRSFKGRVRSYSLNAFGSIQLRYPQSPPVGFNEQEIHYHCIADIRFVDEPPEDSQEEPVATGQFTYTEPGADRKVVGLICDSALVNSEGKLVVHTYWPGEHYIAGMVGRLDIDFAESIFGYHGGTTVYEVLIRGGYADVTFTIDDPCEEGEHDFEAAIKRL